MMTSDTLWKMQHLFFRVHPPPVPEWNLLAGSETLLVQLYEYEYLDRDRLDSMDPPAGCCWLLLAAGCMLQCALCRGRGRASVHAWLAGLPRPSPAGRPLGGRACCLVALRPAAAPACKAAAIAAFACLCCSPQATHDARGGAAVGTRVVYRCCPRASALVAAGRRW
jgi:hypothetical protein